MLAAARLRSGHHPAVSADVVRDTFTGSNGDLLTDHTGEVGATWAGVTGVGFYSQNGILISNRVRGVDDYFCINASGIPATAEYRVLADFYVASVAGFAQICARLQPNADTMYYGGYNAVSGNWELEEVNGGAYTSLGTSAQTLTVGQTYPVELWVLDAVKSFRVAGVEIISSATNVVTAKGRGGIRGGITTDTTGIHIDNFRVVNA